MMHFLQLVGVREPLRVSKCETPNEIGISHQLSIDGRAPCTCPSHCTSGSQIPYSWAHGHPGRYPLAHVARAAGCTPQRLLQLAASSSAALLAPRAKTTGPGGESDTPGGSASGGAAGARSIVIHTYLLR
jgi:hypothetical protein